MNITFLVNRDLHANFSLNMLRPLFGKHQASIFMSEKVGLPKSDWTPPEELLQLKFLEQGLFNNIISSMTENQGDCSSRYLTFDELGDLCHGCSVLENINKPEGLEIFKASEPDLVISIRYGKIIKDPVIAVPKLGVLNLHSGLLPQYQGILTTLYSLIAGESEVGCTLHYIDSGDIDTGEIINTASTSVDKDKSLFWHVSQLYPMGCKMIMEAVDNLESGQALDSYPQDTSKQQYFGLPESKHFAQLKEQGFSVWRSEDVLPIYEAYAKSKLKDLNL
jgi:methionyl-tRNA formyltransferase